MAIRPLVFIRTTALASWVDLKNGTSHKEIVSFETDYEWDDESCRSFFIQKIQQRERGGCLIDIEKIVKRKVEKL